MSRLSRMQESYIVNLCHLFSHILFSFNTMFPYPFDSQNIAVILNVEADALSRPQYHPTYEQVFQSYLEMASLPAYHIQPTIISAINACLSRTLTKATLSDVTKTLSSINSNYFKLDENNWAPKTLL